ncbi:polysaccharide biosynthesis/export family protein [Caminibacter sp.]
MKRLIFLLILALFWGCGAKKNYILFQNDINKTAKTPQKPVKITYQYKIMPGDILQIEIFNHPELTSKTGINGVKVFPNGDIFMPLIGKVKVAGLTEEQAMEKLTKLYAQYIRNPYVNVVDMSKKVYVLGEVRKPGAIQLDKDYTTLIDVISKSGGLTETARRNKIIIISGGLEHPKIREVDLTKLSALNLKEMIIKPDDIVYVQPVGIKPLDVKLQGYQPILNFINTLFSTFANIRYISK